MLKHSCAWDNEMAQRARCKVQEKRCPPCTFNLSPYTQVIAAVLVIAITGCATPQYTIRGIPQPNESSAVVRIERTVSVAQAETFEAKGARAILPEDSPWGLDVTGTLKRLAAVTERPNLHYRPWLYQDPFPNAAALADGRVYLSTGMLKYLESRGAKEDELAFVLSHELAHTVAQHLVKRYQTLQRQQILLSLATAAASLATANASQTGQRIGRVAVDVASIVNELAISSYSQDQELEADQLGVRYMLRAGYDPQIALVLLKDFARTEHSNSWPLFRTHPYAVKRRADLERYLAAINRPAVPARSLSSSATEEKIRRLRDVQKLYAPSSISWRNLQSQIEALQ